jgi:excisionase family DNA binding protein
MTGCVPSVRDRGQCNPYTREPAVTAQQLLTADQLADRWQLPRSAVYRLARERRIPVVVLGRYYRFRLDEIERWELNSALEDAHRAA